MNVATTNIVNSLKFHFIAVVWGAEYTDLFIEVVIPNQLSNGNLPSFKGLDASYYIYTTTEDADRIKKTAAFLRLSDLMPVNFIFIIIANTSNKYNKLSECHKLAITAANKEDAAIIFLSPDAVFADGSFAKLLELCSAGKRAVMTAGLRVTKETFLPLLLKYFSEDNSTLNISSRELIKLAMQHLHPLSQSLFWKSTRFNRYPSHIYWDVPNEGILARAFHVHPLMVAPSRKGISFSSSIDNDYFYQACPDINDIHVVTDSDEIAVIEMSNLMQWGLMPHNKSKALRVAVWAKYNANPHHRMVFQHKIRFHQNDITPAWGTVEQSSDKVVSSILSCLRFETFLLSPSIVIAKIIKRIVGGQRADRVISRLSLLRRKLL